MSPTMQARPPHLDEFEKGVKRLIERGGELKKVPDRYILPAQERPFPAAAAAAAPDIPLPVIDLAVLLGGGDGRMREIGRLREACEKYGFFQLVNHGVSPATSAAMADACRRFFDLPFEERERYMSADMRAPVRCGTSVNQTKDGVFCWRDFLKLLCDYSPDVMSRWPTSPPDLRDVVFAYSKETRHLFLMLMDAVLESLDQYYAANSIISNTSIINNDNDNDNDTEDNIIEKDNINNKHSAESLWKQALEEGSQLIVANCYPPCPQPELTLGMPPHSDYGLLTLLLQDHLVKGLQIHHQGHWLTVEPLPNAFVVNVGDHLEIFSNGRYKSVLHRVLVNSERARTTVVSLNSLSFDQSIRPWHTLINHNNPRRYMDTKFADFLDYISSCEPKKKNFLDSRKLFS